MRKGLPVVFALLVLVPLSAQTGVDLAIVNAVMYNPNNRGFTRHIMHPEPVEGAMQMTDRDHYTRWPAGNMEKLINEAVKTGIPPHIHAIGDAGNRIMLDIYERVLTEQNLLTPITAGASFTPRSSMRTTSSGSAS